MDVELIRLRACGGSVAAKDTYFYSFRQSLRANVMAAQPQKRRHANTTRPPIRARTFPLQPMRARGWCLVSEAKQACTRAKALAPIRLSHGITESYRLFLSRAKGNKTRGPGPFSTSQPSSPLLLASPSSLLFTIQYLITHISLPCFTQENSYGRSQLPQRQVYVSFCPTNKRKSQHQLTGSTHNRGSNHYCGNGYYSRRCDSSWNRWGRWVTLVVVVVAVLLIFFVAS